MQIRSKQYAIVPEAWTGPILLNFVPWIRTELSHFAILQILLDKVLAESNLPLTNYGGAWG